MIKLYFKAIAKGEILLTFSFNMSLYDLFKASTNTLLGDNKKIPLVYQTITKLGINSDVNRNIYNFLTTVVNNPLKKYELVFMDTDAITYAKSYHWENRVVDIYDFLGLKQLRDVYLISMYKKESRYTFQFAITNISEIKDREEIYKDYMRIIKSVDKCFNDFGMFDDIKFNVDVNVIYFAPSLKQQNMFIKFCEGTKAENYNKYNIEFRYRQNKLNYHIESRNLDINKKFSRYDKDVHMIKKDKEPLQPNPEK
jgi:hypothetical protein